MERTRSQIINHRRFAGMEPLTVRPPSNTLIYMSSLQNRPVVVLEFSGKILGFPVVQYIKYDMFRFPPFLDRKYDVLFDLASYTRVPEDGWQMILLFKRWLDYQSKKIVFKKFNQDISDWIVKFKQERLFTFLDAERKKTT